MTVARATPKTPKGNPNNRSEKYSQEMLPVSRNEAMMVSTNRLIWVMETANKVGIIKVTIRFTPSRSRPRRGNGRSLSLSRKGI